MRVRSTLPNGLSVRSSLLLWTLLCVPLIDELIAGLPVIAMPLLRDDLALSYTQVGLIFTVGQIVSLVFTPAINLLSDRRAKRLPVVAGMLGLAVGYLLVANAPTFAVLLVAFSLIEVSGSAALGLAQATLIDRDIDDAPRTMARWTTGAAVGDLLSPIAVAAAVAWGLGWRPLFWVAALLWLVMACIVWLQRFPAAHSAAEGDAPHPGALASLREALVNPLLLRWTLIVLVCSMLDEVFLGFASLYLADVVAASPAAVSLLLGGQMVGGLVGLLLLHRLLDRISRGRLLAGSALLVLCAVVAFLALPAVSVAAVALFLIGLGASSWYPLAAAAAYATMPGRSGTVRAVNALGMPFEIAVPFVVGLAAQRWGIAVGVGLLGLAPLFVLLLLPRGRRFTAEHAKGAEG